MASMVFSRAALVLVGLGVATVEGYGLAGRTTLARSALLAAAPARVGPAAALQMNIFEKAVSGAASAIGSQLGRVAGMPEMSEAEQKAMEKAMLDGTLNFDQFLIQLRVITKAGSIAAIAAKIPGAGDKIDPRAAAMAEEKLKRYEAYMGHMTNEERADASLVLPGNPQALKRIERIAKSADVRVDEIGQFLGEFQVMRKTSQAMAQGKSPDEVRQAMMAAQDEQGMMNRAERRSAAKEVKKGQKSSTKGFGA